MDKYEDWTDDQINKEVGRHHNIYHTYEECINLLGEGSDNTVNPKYDPCNNWAEAGPIITESRIGVSPVQLGIDRYHPAKDLWRASHYNTYDNVFTKSGDSPLRCAMIVFLKMQAAK